MKYEGDFKNNKIEGYGVWNWPNGDVYEGNFLEGKYDGFGKEKLINGETYEGISSFFLLSALTSASASLSPLFSFSFNSSLF